MSIWREVIRAAVEEALPYSFGDPQRITEWAELFVEAHQQAPGGLSLEIGTWRGGTALVLCRLLERLYPIETRPMLFTIDPYGMKPYNGGDSETRRALYGDPDYVIMKKLLARFPHHAHFYLTSADFFAAMERASYWQRGDELDVANVTFALVDGEHDAEAIAGDVCDVLRRLAPDGVVVVDNVDNDPKTAAMLVGELEALGVTGTLDVRPCALRRDDRHPQEYAVVRRQHRRAEAACQ